MRDGHVNESPQNLDRSEFETVWRSADKVQRKAVSARSGKGGQQITSELPRKTGVEELEAPKDNGQKRGFLTDGEIILKPESG